jgi:hypothetical protein
MDLDPIIARVVFADFVMDSVFFPSFDVQQILQCSDVNALARYAYDFVIETHDKRKRIEKTKLVEREKREKRNPNPKG